MHPSRGKRCCFGCDWWSGGFLAVMIEKNGVVCEDLRFDQVTLRMTYKLSLIPAKGLSRQRVEDMLSDANNVAEPFYGNLKAKNVSHMLTSVC